MGPHRGHPPPHRVPWGFPPLFPTSRWFPGSRIPVHYTGEGGGVVGLGVRRPLPPAFPYSLNISLAGFCSLPISKPTSGKRLTAMHICVCIHMRHIRAHKHSYFFLLSWSSLFFWVKMFDQKGFLELLPSFLSIQNTVGHCNSSLIGETLRAEAHAFFARILLLFGRCFKDQCGAFVRSNKCADNVVHSTTASAPAVPTARATVCVAFLF